MGIWPFLRREYVVSVRRGDLFRDRLRAAAAVGLAVAAWLIVWDYWLGWDRASVAGAALFAHVAFGLVVAMQTSVAIGLVIPVSKAVAGERDKKTLDALLATRLSGPEIVFGVMAAGLFRCANGLAATVPVVVLMVYLGGVDPWYGVVAGAGLAPTAVAVAALSAVATVESRTAGRAVRGAVGLMYVWFVFPALLPTLRGVLPAALPGWVIAPMLWALDSSPLGVAGNLPGLFPRPWGLVEGVFRMAALQLGVAAVLTAWAVWRLRPASRGLYDVEGRAGLLKALRAANRTLPKRRPCGSDPVFWNERYGYRVKNRVGRSAGRVVGLTSLGALVVVVWWLAAPAFAELAGRGYGPSAEAYSMPDVPPLTRVIVERLIVRTYNAARPGQARLELNLGLRNISAILAMGFVVTTLSYGAAGVVGERQRDTWLGLLATPLTGRDVVRGKSLGALWRSRTTVAALLGLWTVGLAAGAVHPLGYLTALAWLAASCVLYPTIGVAAGLQQETPTLPLNPTAWPLRLLTWLGAAGLTMALPIVLASASLFTYEDVHAAAGSGPLPEFEGWWIRPWIGARAVVFACLAGTAAVAVFAVRYPRALAASFDALVGRPCRPGGLEPKEEGGLQPQFQRAASA